ncbi:CLUMA_CG012775, isoform A [Clunio marinus]|uniref:CLUMA_CG012775, isoform A n=1 Tax=Clunio marinus TaxID=568069 RepID=A0A1J1IHQ2_9DIPT|nr:CLUMA_CG012775, isoform A [Clunio marinus]
MSAFITHNHNTYEPLTGMTNNTLYLEQLTFQSMMSADIHILFIFPPSISFFSVGPFTFLAQIIDFGVGMQQKKGKRKKGKEMFVVIIEFTRLKTFLLVGLIREEGGDSQGP